MLTQHDVYNVIRACSFRDWTFHVGGMGDGFYLQLRFNARNAEPPLDMVEQSGRKWYISPHSTVSEIVHTVLKAVLTATEHEAREEFMFDGEPIFHPHHSIGALLGIVTDTERRAEVPA